MESKYVTPDYVKELTEKIKNAYPIEHFMFPIYLKAAIKVCIDNGMTIDDVQKILDKLKQDEA